MEKSRLDQIDSISTPILHDRIATETCLEVVHRLLLRTEDQG